MKGIEDHAEVEVLILGNVLLIVGGIAAAFGLTTLASGGIGLALVGLLMFALGAVWLVKAFKEYQWEDFKVLWKTSVSLAQTEREKKNG